MTSFVCRIFCFLSYLLFFFVKPTVGRMRLTVIYSSYSIWNNSMQFSGDCVQLMTCAYWRNIFSSSTIMVVQCASQWAISFYYPITGCIRCALWKWTDTYLPILNHADRFTHIICVSNPKPYTAFGNQAKLTTTLLAGTIIRPVTHVWHQQFQFVCCQVSSLDFVVNRLFMKLFKTSNIRCY